MMDSEGSWQGLHPIPPMFHVDLLEGRKEVLTSPLCPTIGPGSMGLAVGEMDAQLGTKGPPPLAHELGAHVRVDSGGYPKGFPSRVEDEVGCFFCRKSQLEAGTCHNPAREAVHTEEDAVIFLPIP